MLGMLDKTYTARIFDKGLSSSAAAERLARFGPNDLSAQKKARPLKIFLGQFRDVMVMVLVAATAVSFFLGEYYDALTIAVIVLLNALLGFIQEYKTEKTLLALKNLTAPTAKVYRDGKMTVIPASELVPDDIIALEAGDRVPADAVLLREKGLHAEESILTGESASVTKEAGDVNDADNSIGRQSVVYGGTTITKGNAEAKVIATGKNSQIGKISGMLDGIDGELTPLQKRLAELGRVVAVICIAVCAIVALAGLLRGEPAFDMLMTGITIAIAAIPEGLPATVTIALALAVGRMLKKNALVNKLHSVETLGCTSVICTDKTGTVTENKMSVSKLWCGGKEYDVSGTGYRAEGEITVGGTRVNPKAVPILSELLTCAVLCNNASLSAGTAPASRERGRLEGKGEFSVIGDSTEAALLIAGAKAGLSAERLSYNRAKLDEVPFDSETRRMTVLYGGAGSNTAYSKGSPDVILGKCAFIRTENGVAPLTWAQKREISEKIEDMTKNALRVLAFCEKEANHVHECESGMVFLGLAGLLDPPRAEAKRAVKLCRSAHIKTVMVTGDHKNTAVAIAKQAGILRAGDICLTGAELSALSDGELEARLDKITVFARVNPSDKLRIVRAFKKKGHIVTMTGDGVNDAPAVKEAHIGVAMGITGTDVTKQAADLVLLDDNFATLVGAVEQGRGIYANIRKFVRYLLSCNIGEVFTMFAGILAGFPMVLLPAQILLVNLVTDGLPAVALGVEPPDRENMKKPPRKAGDSFFSDGLMLKIILRGILIGVCTLGSFAVLNGMFGNVNIARTGALFTLVLTQLAHVFECKSESGNIFTVPYGNNPKLILAVLTSLAVIAAAIYLPLTQAVFSTVPLTAQQLFIALCFALFAPLLQSVFKA